VDPGDADAFADSEFRDVRTEGSDVSNDLMSGNHGKPRRRKPAVHEIEVGAAHAADRDAHENLAR
jgi:hypothetical protein